ncbi:MAG TPA: hypothetical protein VHU81_18835 [Thermoanaerobaculia bacterium]|nr:hypothetical protein [Thermoanaerobaculia bacterium]
MHEPAYRWVPSYKETFGDLAYNLSVELGMPMDPEQRMILDAIFAENAPGEPACFSVAVVAPRQNLKTATLEIAALMDIFHLGEPVHTWTAHLFDTAQKTFVHMCQLIEGNDDYRRRVKAITKGNGKEAIELTTGERIEFAARSLGGGRGKTGDKITWDEALFLQPGDTGALLPILATRKGAQVRYGSSAGFVKSVVLRRIRNRGRAGGHPRSAYFEWCAPLTECEDPACDHELGSVGCVADRLDLLAQANPALGRRITEERLRDFREEMPPEEFIREFLGWWDEPGTADAAFGPGRWEACAGDPPLGLPMGAIGVAASMDQTHGAITAATWDGEIIHLKPLQHGPGTHWVVDRVKQIQREHRVPVAIDRRGPAAPLIPHLEAAKVDLMLVDTTQVLDACANLLEKVREGKVRHARYPELDLAVSGAVRRVVGDRWAWGRKVSSSDISTLEAGTLAAYVVTLPVEEKPPPPAPVSLSGSGSTSSDSVLSMNF